VWLRFGVFDDDFSTGGFDWWLRLVASTGGFDPGMRSPDVRSTTWKVHEQGMDEQLYPNDRSIVNP
jgi:hypothetical protein